MQLKQVEGQENYLISNEGIVYSYRGPHDWKPLMPDNINGHERVTIKGKKVYVDQLVMEYFGTTRPHFNDKIWHIDGDNGNNNIKNLVWLSNSKIQLYSTYSKEYRKSAEFLDELRAYQNS